MWRRGRFLAAAWVIAACGSTSASAPDSDAGAIAPPPPPPGDDGGAPPPPPTDAGSDSGSAIVDTLDANRDRLLATYLAFLKSNPSATQTNGLSGATVTDVCDLWSKLDASSQDVYLTLTHRMFGSKLGADGSSMLAHVVKAYRVVGGQDAKTSPPGSCGGGEYNRMIMSMDGKLHDTLVVANAKQGATEANGKPDILDIPTHSNDFWRDSHDVGGPHAPFDLSDETDPGAPRGQVQFFKDVNSTIAKAPLGRQDLTTLVDPLALEMDQDYDCPHNSNPACDYVLYGTACIPQTSMNGTAIYTMGYGDFGKAWKPTGCP